jgi:hypothetical protein
MASCPGHFTLEEIAYGTQWTVEWLGLDHAQSKKVFLCWDSDWLPSQSLHQLSYPSSAADWGVVTLEMISYRIARVNRNVCLVFALMEIISILHSEVSHSWSFYSACGDCDDYDEAEQGHETEIVQIYIKKLKLKLCGLSPRVNYTDRVTACWQSYWQLLRIEGVMWSA